MRPSLASPVGTSGGPDIKQRTAPPRPCPAHLTSAWPAHGPLGVSPVARVGAPLCCSQRPRVCRAAAEHPPHPLNRVLGTNAPSRLCTPRLPQQVPWSCPPPPTACLLSAGVERPARSRAPGRRPPGPRTLHTASVCHSLPPRQKAGAPPPSSLCPHHISDCGSPPGRATRSRPAVTTEDTGQTATHRAEQQGRPSLTHGARQGLRGGQAPGQEETGCRPSRLGGPEGRAAQVHPAPQPGQCPSPLLWDALLRESSRGT